MSSSKYRFTLDVHSTQSQVALPAMRGDTNRTLYINFSDGGQPYHIETGCLAKLTIKRPKGSRIVEFCEVRNNSTVVYPFSQNKNTCVESGIHDCDISLVTLDGETLTSPRFSLIVSDTVVNSDDIGISETEKNEITAILQREAERQEAERGREAAETQREINEAERQAKAEALVSPTVTTTPIATGHRVTVTDVNGTSSFDVNDGEGTPKVTVADNNKIMMVVDGVWRAVELPIYDGSAEIVISFTINGTQLIASPGMTWEDWCDPNGSYNVLGAVVGADGHIYDANEENMLEYNGHSVTKTDQIIDDAEYIWAAI